MKRAIDLRLEKLEKSGSADIAIWCDSPDDVSHTVEQMISAGELREADRARCIHWSMVQGAPGTHERALAVLS